MAVKLAVAVLLLTQSISAVINSRFPSTPLGDLKKQTASNTLLLRRDVNPSTLYPAHNISVPVDHFHNESMYEPHSDATFPLRYWFDATYYKDGGPVIVLQGGETSGAGRLPYLQKGIVYQLAKATGGIGVILEHRYYGKSFPTPDLSTANLRFLTTEQALADEAYFAQNIVFPGLESKNLTAPSTAYIGYGGSYAGAFNAFLRIQYPHVFWGEYLLCKRSRWTNLGIRDNILFRSYQGDLRILAILRAHQNLWASKVRQIDAKACQCDGQYLREAQQHHAAG